MVTPKKRNVRRIVDILCASLSSRAIHRIETSVSPQPFAADQKKTHIEMMMCTEVGNLTMDCLPALG
jgi:hypothetical protein